MGIILIIFSVLIIVMGTISLAKRAANEIFPITGVLVGVVLAVLGILML